MISRRSASLILVTLALAGCSGGSGLVRDAVMASGVTGGEPKPAPDFISATRNPEAGYIPVSAAPPPRAIRRKTTTEVGGAEAEMEALRKRNEARGARARKAATTP